MVHRIAQLTRLLPALWSIGGEAFRPLTGHSFSVQSHDVTALNARRLWTHDVSSTKVGVGWTLLRATVASEADIPSKGPPTKSRPHIQSKPNADSRSVEREVAHLGRIGKTNDALALYWSVWEADHDNRLTVRAKPTTRLMNAAIDACARAKPPRTEEARRILSEGMDGGDSGIRRLSPNVYTFGALMSVMTRARDSNGALRLLRSMQEEYRIKPNAVVYSTAISACERSIPPRPDLALKLLREATDDPSIELSVVGYNAAISTLARAEDWRTAVRLLNEMEGCCEVSGSVFDEGMRYRTGADADGSKILQTSLLNPDVVKPCPDEITYGTVMAACERSGEWRMVLNFADSLRSRGESDPAFAMDGMTITSALHACQRLGLADEALSYLEMMNGLTRDKERRRTHGRNRKGARSPLCGPDEVAYRLAISACARSRDDCRWMDCIRLLNEMGNATGVPPDVVAYTAAISGCAEAGKYELAFQLVDRMKNEGVEPNVVTFTTVIQSCAKAIAIAAEKLDKDDGADERLIRQPMEKALDLLQQMKNPGSVVKPNIVTYNAAIRACAEGLSLESAFKLMDDLRLEGLTPTVVTYGSLMTACERVGSVSAASKVFQMIKEQQHSDVSLQANEIIYGAAISTCRKAGQKERALLLLRKTIKSKLSVNTATFNTVIMSQIEGREPDLDKAVIVYRLMGSKFAPSARPNRQTYSLLIRALAENLHAADAESMLNQMCAAGLRPDVDLYTRTVAAYEKTKQPMKALRLMESMQEEGFNFYEIKVLDEALKRAVKLVNVVGGGLQRQTLPSVLSENQNSAGDNENGDVSVDMPHKKR